MYKVEITFDTNELAQDEVEKMCEQTDRIFEREDLNCAVREPGKRVYLDCGRKEDYGGFWAAIFALKDSAWLKNHLQECFWYNGNNKENLITEFMRK